MPESDDPHTAALDDKERARLAAVRRYDILDTPPDGAFDRITALAARLFDVPIAVVSIVDEDRIWFKSHHGLEATETERDGDLGSPAIFEEAPLVVSDAAVDPGGSAGPLVAGDANLRFYAAAPLVTADGHSLGTLSILDVEPREMTDADSATLGDLAAVVMDELELRLSSQRLLALAAELQAQTVVKSRLAEQAARTDPLTGLRNRRALDIDLRAHADQAQAVGADVAVVVIDLDGLKSVNDNEGHARGDTLLRDFAGALRDAFRSTDLLYRVGGDEFTLTIPVKESEDLHIIDDRVSAAVDQVRRRGFPAADASAGVALLSEADWEQDEALRIADERMYDDKRDHRARRKFDLP